ncbi:protein translocase subunit SecF [Clostridium hydrogenum]|uniref:protein translocase subunit SecF n=1 Tax=Clostridium hydrogenum TaxID=2855764 RepID=UPI001F32E11B|nr:protein translocase subunit SecF [Clostridium hydrogenum]
MLKIIERTKIWFTISLTIIFLGVAFMIYNGATTGKPLEFGLDFAGGNVMDVNINKSFNRDDVQKIVDKYVKDATVNKTNSGKAVEIKSGSITDNTQSKIFNDLKSKYKLNNKDLTSQTVGASVGKELEQKAIMALVIANILVLIYIGIRFEFKFGLAAIISLVHDILITLACYAIFRITINTPFIAGMLTVVGYSVADTVVIFDRIRENQKKSRRMELAELANTSLTQTIVRSIYTVLTVVISVLSVHIFVPSVREFTIPLLVGIISGCYSSIFIASPLWVIFKKRSDRKKAKLKAAN